MQRYVALDSLITSLSKDQEFLLALNGLTNLNSEEMLGVLGEVVNYASAKDGLNASLSLYNNETYTKGYAYSTKTNRGEKEEWIGFNTRSNDLTKPHEVINTIFHETSNKELHHRSKNDAYANNRGNTAENIFALKTIEVKILIL